MQIVIDLSDNEVRAVIGSIGPDETVAEYVRRCGVPAVGKRKSTSVRMLSGDIARADKLPVLELAARAGVSYPTVAKALRGEVIHHKKHSAILRAVQQMSGGAK